jgi:hypothetical protein
MVEAMSTSLFEPSTSVNFGTSANAYLDRIRKQTARYINTPTGDSNPATDQVSPNEQFTVQQSAQHGNLIAPRQDIYKGIQDREDQTAQMGDIATQNQQDQLKQRRSLNQYNTDNGSADNFTGDGANSGLDSEQLSNAKLIANVGRQRGLGDNDIQIALMTALTESGLRNLNHGDRDSVGLFQQRTSQGWGNVQQIMDPNYSAGKFYDALGKSARGATPWQTAQNVQRSAFADGSNYAKQYALAQKAFNAINGTGSIKSAVGSGTPALQSWLNANNNKYIDYDGAYGAQCVDLYDTYTQNFVGGKPIMVGYAPEIYNHYDSNAYNRLGNNAPSRMGDVAIWGQGPYTPSGHVAIVVGDNGNGTLRVLQSNATNLGSRGNSIISNISKSALIGYLRPKKLG